MENLLPESQLTAVEESYSMRESLSVPTRDPFLTSLVGPTFVSRTDGTFRIKNELLKVDEVKVFL